MRVEFARLSRNEPQLREFVAVLARAYDVKSVADYGVGPEVEVTWDDATAAIATAERLVGCNAETGGVKPRPPARVLATGRVILGISAMRALWERDEPAYAGDYARFQGARMRPKPYAGTVPIVIGGHSAAAARRAGRLAQGVFPARGASRDVSVALYDAARTAGRDPTAIEITVSAPHHLARIPDLAATGIGRLLVPVTANGGLPGPISAPDDLLAWRDVIARDADGPPPPIARIRR